MQYTVLYVSVFSRCAFFVLCVCITNVEMYCLPSLCAEINVSFKRFRVCIWAWRSPQPARRVCVCVCVCVHTQLTSSTDGMRGIETPFVFEGRNGSDLRPSNPGHALLSLTFPLSFSLSFLIHPFFIPKLFHPHFYHRLNFFFFFFFLSDMNVMDE